MNKKIFLKIAFSLAFVLITAEIKAAELPQNEEIPCFSNHENFALVDQCAPLEGDVICSSEDRIMAIFGRFMKEELDRKLEFCELELLLNSNTPLPDSLKAVAFDTLPNATEEEIRLGLGLIQIKVMMGITPCEVKNPRCVPDPLSHSRKRIRRNSAVF